MRRRFLRNLDKLAGRPVALAAIAYDCLFGRWRNRPREHAKEDTAPRSILAIKMVGLGDTVLMLTPLARLQERFPGVRITALVTPLSAGILMSQPSIDQVLIFDALAWPSSIARLARLIRLLRGQRFDCVIDFEQHFLMTAVLAWMSGAPRRIGFRFGSGLRGRLYTDPVGLDPQKHMIEAYSDLLKPLGVPSMPARELVRIHLGEADQARVAAWLERHGIQAGDVLVGIHPGSGPRSTRKRWPKERFAEIVQRTTAAGKAKVIVTGTSEEQELVCQVIGLSGGNSAIDAAGQFEPRELAALAARCTVFLSNDTGVMHIAAAVGTPTIGLFGPETPQRYAPVGAGNVAIYKPPACSPCVAIHLGRVQDCERAGCMTAITVEDVWNAMARCGVGKA